MSLQPLPAPRLQFRWKPIKHQSGANWMCFYELVIALQKHDIRRRKRGPLEFSVTLGRTRVTRTGLPILNGEVDVPFRDGAHASWDKPQLGNLPVYAICGEEVTLVKQRN